MKYKLIFTITILTVLTTLGLMLFYSSFDLKMNRFIRNDEYYEAYKHAAKHERLDEFKTNPSIQFYDVMANHYQIDIISDEGWFLPDFTGWSCAEIAYALNNIGQKYKIEFTENKDCIENQIVKQYPVKGEKVYKDDTIVLIANNNNSNQNVFYNGGINFKLCAEYGEWAYYTYNDSVYKSKIDGTQADVVYSSTEGFNICSIFNIDGFLYILEKQNNDEQNNIRIVNAETRNTTDFEVAFFVKSLINNGDIYINSKINYLFNSENEIIEELKTSVKPYIFNNDDIYYLEQVRENGIFTSAICKCKEINGEKEYIIQEDGNITSFVIYDNVIFYILIEKREDKFYDYLIKYDMESKKRSIIQLITKESTTVLGTSKINIWNDKIIVGNLNGEYLIFNKDSKEAISIINSISTIQLRYNFINEVVGNYIVYNYYKNDDITQPLIGLERLNILTGKMESIFFSK